MAIVTTNEQHYHDIANAIREEALTDKQYTPSEMADGIYEAGIVQYQQGLMEGHRVESGIFIPEQDTNCITLNIPAGAKMVEIIPMETPTIVSSTRYPLHYLLASEAFQENNKVYKGQGAVVQYSYGSKFYTSFYAFDASAGFTAAFDTALVFEANIPYRWTAHYWQA